MSDWGPPIAAISWALVVAGVGGALTDLGPWYKGLKRPAIQPPDWLFGPAWTVIFALTAFAGVLAWGGADAGARRLVVGLFVVNGLLNVFWNVLFFTLRRPDWALLEVGALWLSILAMVVAFWPMSPAASLLVIPYLAWVGFASLLNREVVRINRPFPGRS